LLSGKQVMLGAGVVIDPQVLVDKELSMLSQKGIIPLLTIDTKAHVITPYHKLLDAYHEESFGKAAAGSTKSGIAPVYSDKHARVGVRVQDMLDDAKLREKLELARKRFFEISKALYGKENIQVESCTDSYLKYAATLKQYAGDVSCKINLLLDSKKLVLFEAAQAAMLDIDHGLYPFGTSSNTIAGAACTGAGVGPTKIKRVFGVIKAYTSRVGNGPLPTELVDETGSKIREKGHEYGTTTGRPRRVGWLDLACVKYAVQLNGVTDLCIVHLDTLAGFEKIKVCTGYKIDGKEFSGFPTNTEEFAKAQPIYKNFRGWEDLGEQGWQEVAKKNSLDAFPQNCQKYLKFIKRFLGVPITILGVGPDREKTLVLKELPK